jgi:hypothetical protein
LLLAPEYQIHSNIQNHLCFSSLPTKQISIKRISSSQADEAKALKAHLKHRALDSPSLFTNNRGLPITRNGLLCLMKQYREEANIPPDKQYFHVLKHSIATHLLDANAELRFIQDWLSHSNIQNRTYLCTGNILLIANAGSLDPAFPFSTFVWSVAGSTSRRLYCSSTFGFTFDTTIVSNFSSTEFLYTQFYRV